MAFAPANLIRRGRGALAILAVLAMPVGAPAMAQPAEVDAGTLTIALAWARATPPGAANAAGYVTITNNGTEPDRLLAVESPAAELVRIHETTVENEVAGMTEVEGGLPIPSGEAVVLAPGGFHLMFTGLTRPFAEGDSVAVTLVFERAGRVDLSLAVRPVGAAAPQADDEATDHSAMDHEDGE